MGLSGLINVDTLLELSNFNSFSVINNSFEGPMHAFKKLESLRALFLSNNKFSGDILDDAFDGMGPLKRVFLVENGFTGHIPTSLANLPGLLEVNLHGNRFEVSSEVLEFQHEVRSSEVTAESKVMVLNGPVMVVKRFQHMNNLGKKEFFEHMKRLGRLTHPNLLPPVAFFYNEEDKLLVHDFVENGSLASHLHGMT
ncbi:pollen receptor-like kinase 2 [Gastrolobium bilobum]|uniref:pollen receptor-like kinase 2 n=1 Tax=Gastrolobium bilobum TaxID=150636 RepID=UPI002AB09993|nr:pollen receptor-like kinase 2 [Gastrolobium bilobum]